MTQNKIIVESPISAAMGAKLSVTGPARGMYLIVGSGRGPESLVKAAAGDVVLRLNGWKMLAVLPFAGYLGLRGDHRISHIGPVSIDLKRLATLADILGRADRPTPKGG